MPTQAEIQREITHRIIDGILFGTVPWRKPWRNDPNCGAPTNVVSRHPYAGVNPILLDLVAMTRGYQSKYWGTYQQWASLGAQVMRRPANVEPGKWGTSIVLWKQIQKAPKDEESKPETFPFLRYFTVFNIEQVEGEAVDHLRASVEVDATPASIDYESAQQVVDATGATITYGGDQAFYMRPVGEFPHHTGGDHIRMPPKNWFFQEHAFYATLMHELCHWSEIRLDWTGRQTIFSAFRGRGRPLSFTSALSLERLSTYHRSIQVANSPCRNPTRSVGE